MTLLLFLDSIISTLHQLEDILAVRIFLWGVIGLLVCGILLSIYTSWEEKKRLEMYRRSIVKRPSIPEQDLTRAQLLDYTGADSEKPILIAVDGTIYDVTAGSGFYGPGSAYNVFAGRDATRNLATGDLDPKGLENPSKEGLTEDELAVLNQWINLFSTKYKVVGKLLD